MSILTERDFPGLSLITFAVSLCTMEEGNSAALTTPDGELVGHYHMSDAAGFMTGEVLVIDDGWSARGYS